MTDKKARYRIGWVIEEATESGDVLPDGNRWATCMATTGDPAQLALDAHSINISLSKHAELLGRDLLIRSNDTPEQAQAKEAAISGAEPHDQDPIHGAHPAST